MKKFTILIPLLCHFSAFTQIVPNVSVDSLFIRMFPLYSKAIRSGIYDLPRDTSWKNLKQHEFEGISIQLPENWLSLGGLGSIVEAACDASELYFPDTLNGRPILVGVFILNWPGNSLEEVKDVALKDYRSNPDRVFEAGYVDSVYKYNLANGESGYVLHTRFLRISNQFNQSRYDLILFSEKVKKGYSVMVSVQYADPAYVFEKDSRLDLFAGRIFAEVSLR